MSISQDSAATIVCREVFDETSHPTNEGTWQMEFPFFAPTRSRIPDCRLSELADYRGSTITWTGRSLSNWSMLRRFFPFLVSFEYGNLRDFIEYARILWRFSYANDWNIHRARLMNQRYHQAWPRNLFIRVHMYEFRVIDFYFLMCNKFIKIRARIDHIVKYIFMNFHVINFYTSPSW